MSELVVVGFKKDMYRASQVLNVLADLNSNWKVELDDAVAAYRDYDGKLRVDQSFQMTSKEGAGWGALLGGLLGAIVALPFTAGATAPVAVSAAAALGAGTVGGGVFGATLGAVDAASWKEDFGISEEFVNSVGTMVQPGDSAIFALLRTLDRKTVEEQFRGYGGTILSTTLTPEQQWKVESTLHSR